MSSSRLTGIELHYVILLFFAENIQNTCRVMCKKYHIGTKQYNDIISNRMPSEPTEEWRHIIESVNKTCVAWPSSRHVYSDSQNQHNDCNY